MLVITDQRIMHSLILSFFGCPKGLSLVL